MERLFDLSGKIALVTGAASGLGRAIAVGLAKAGASVSAADIDLEGAERTAEEIRVAGGKAIALQVDVCEPAQVKKMVDSTLAEFNSLDIAFNIPGINVRKYALELSEEEWDRVIDVNLKGVFLCAKCVGKIMVQQRRGSMINMASIFGAVCMPRQVAYASSKGGVLQMTKVLAVEWAPYGVRVNALAPAYVKTPLVRQVMEDKAWYEDVRGRTPLGRLAEPEEIVGPALFLASDASSYVTGTVIFVDGGWTAL